MAFTEDLEKCSLRKGSKIMTAPIGNLLKELDKYFRQRLRVKNKLKCQ